MAAFLIGLSRRLAARGFSPDRFQLTMARPEIANYLRLAPETVSRVLKRLQDDGLLRLDRRELEIDDQARLGVIAAPVLWQQYDRVHGTRRHRHRLRPWEPSHAPDRPCPRPGSGCRRRAGAAREARRRPTPADVLHRRRQRAAGDGVVGGVAGRRAVAGDAAHAAAAAPRRMAACD